MNTLHRSLQHGTIAALAVVLTWTLGGCQESGRRLRSPAMTPLVHAWERRFDQAWLWKPAPGAGVSGLGALHAPLLLWETPASTNGAPVGSLALYVFEASGTVAGRRRQCLIYLWRCSGTDAAPHRSSWQGYRVWLGVAGQPVLWETRAEGQQPPQLFVARHWEEAAATRFGPATLPRRFAVERGSATGPRMRAVVAEIFDDAPLPMGPLVHVARDCQILSLVCRCSPPRVTRLVGQSYYDLRSGVEAWEVDPEGLPLPRGAGDPWLSEAELEQSLHWLEDI
ncbi:MAG: hypothetical protein RMN51_05275 [Verrucomicrobiota bacterium]|nr:hypothetical protein [Limisphaera sp.]MDW8381503.1 hypothetical protein [Verrucomicrobiota bacterium]